MSAGGGLLLQNRQSQYYYDDRVRRPPVQPATVPAVQPASAQALRPVPAEMPDHRGLSTGPLLPGNRKECLPAAQGTNTTDQSSVAHRVGGVRNIEISKYYRNHNANPKGHFF